MLSLFWAWPGEKGDIQAAYYRTVWPEMPQLGQKVHLLSPCTDNSHEDPCIFLSGKKLNKAKNSPLQWSKLRSLYDNYQVNIAHSTRIYKKDHDNMTL